VPGLLVLSALKLKT